MTGHKAVPEAAWRQMIQHTVSNPHCRTSIFFVSADLAVAMASGANLLEADHIWAKHGDLAKPLLRLCGCVCVCAMKRFFFTFSIFWGGGSQFEGVQDSSHPDNMFQSCKPSLLQQTLRCAMIPFHSDSVFGGMR